MSLEIIVLVLGIILTAFIVWFFTSRYYLKRINEIKDENSLHVILNDFKKSIDNYQKAHAIESVEIKNAISTAQKYAKALSTNQNLQGEFGEDWLEQILKFSGLQENIHYTKQFSNGNIKPDFVLNLPQDKHLIIDSKVILKNYVDYINSDNDFELKKLFITDLNNCINSLAKKNYEEMDKTSQPGFILMFIPIESCISLLYTDYDFKKVIENANSKNIFIIGNASLMVTLRLINQLWASKIQSDNIQNIIETGQKLYNNIALHSQNLIEIETTIKKAYESVQTEINRFTQKNNGSIFKEAEKLKDFGIEAKCSKSGKKIIEQTIAKEFISNNTGEK